MARTKAGGRAASGRVSPRRDPVIGVEVVDQLPVNRRQVNDRTTRYARAMAEARKKAKPGQWVRIATFDSVNGAAGVKRAILAGERAIDGPVSDWDIEARRLDGGGSGLFVSLKPKRVAKPKR